MGQVAFLGALSSKGALKNNLKLALDILEFIKNAKKKVDSILKNFVIEGHSLFNLFWKKFFNPTKSIFQALYKTNLKKFYFQILFYYYILKALAS